MLGEALCQFCGWGQWHQHWQQCPFIDQQCDLRLPEQGRGVPISEVGRRRGWCRTHGQFHPVEQLLGAMKAKAHAARSDLERLNGAFQSGL